MGVRSVCLGQSRSPLIRFCHGIWARDHGNIAIWWAIPQSVSEHPSFPSALIVFQKLRCIISNVRYKLPPMSVMNSRRFMSSMGDFLPYALSARRPCGRFSGTSACHREVG
jgi:hypothetical protein